jgi:hypothetical protein
MARVACGARFPAPSSFHRDLLERFGPIAALTILVDGFLIVFARAKGFCTYGCPYQPRSVWRTASRALHPSPEARNGCHHVDVPSNAGPRGRQVPSGGRRGLHECMTAERVRRTLCTGATASRGAALARAKSHPPATISAGAKARPGERVPAGSRYAGCRLVPFLLAIGLRHHSSRCGRVRPAPEVALVPFQSHRLRMEDLTAGHRRRSQAVGLRTRRPQRRRAIRAPLG